MSLRTKITVILSIVVGVYTLVDNFVQRRTIGREFEDLQDVEAREDLQRVVAALEREQQVLRERAGDWAGREATLRLARDGERSSFEAALAPGLEGQVLDLVFVIGTDGEVLASRIESPVSRERLPRLREFRDDRFPPTHPLLKRDASSQALAGLMMTEEGALLVGTYPITGAQGEAPVGTVILGRFLHDELFAELGERIHVTFHVSSVLEPDLPIREAGLIDAITTAAGPVYRDAPDGRMHVYSTHPDVLGFPTLLVRTEIEPEIRRGGERSMNGALLSALVTGCLVMLVLLRVLSKIVLGPVAQLTQVATRIGQTDDTTARTNIRRDDEIGQLSGEFDSMLEKLELSRQQVIQTSRLAGMSEIATGVLHNVGNVLNSVNVSANLVTRQTEQLPVTDLAAMRDVLTENQEDLARFFGEDPRAAHFLPFVDEVSRALESGKGAILEELGGLQKGVEHMGELVRSQQSLAGRHGVLEPVQLADLLHQAVAICRQAGRADDGVEVVHELEDLPKVEVDRHKLMEILVNLVKNAIDAMGDVRKRRLILRLTRVGEDRVRIEVADNGSGIEPDALARIFSHGFTTKADGHGYGLHVSANAATEMGGTLHAESDGAGHGATFIVELPAVVHPTAVAA